MGAGIALSASLGEGGPGGVGVGLLGLGVVFLVLGLTQKKKVESGKLGDDEDERPHA